MTAQFQDAVCTGSAHSAGAPVRFGVYTSCFLMDRSGDYADGEPGLLKIGFLSLVVLQTPRVPLPLTFLLFSWHSPSLWVPEYRPWACTLWKEQLPTHTSLSQLLSPSVLWQPWKWGLHKGLLPLGLYLCDRQAKDGKGLPDNCSHEDDVTSGRVTCLDKCIPDKVVSQENC